MLSYFNRLRGTQFLIDGEPFHFTGFRAHEDSELRGKGYDQAYMVHDFKLRHWVGASSFRTSHYPYAEEVMEFANRKGVVVIYETSGVGLNIGHQDGFEGEAALTLSPEAMNNEARDAHAASIRELISRDKNHASVFMWTIANEPAAEEESSSLL